MKISLFSEENILGLKGIGRESDNLIMSLIKDMHRLQLKTLGSSDTDLNLNIELINMVLKLLLRVILGFMANMDFIVKNHLHFL